MSDPGERFIDEPSLEDLPSLAAFGERLMDADPRRGRTRGRRGTTGGAALLGSLVALATFTGAAAVALTATTGSPVPSFARGDDVGFYPEPGTIRLSDVRAVDPSGGPAWTVRVGRSGDGLVCLGVGQVRGRAFGVRGLDRVFRPVPPAGNDVCGPAPTDRRPAVALRTFSGPDAASPDGATTVVYGTGGAGLRGLTVTTGDGVRRAVPVGRSGTFVLAVPGWPEGVAPTVTLRTSDDRVRTVGLGSTGYLPDSDGRYGWSVWPVFRVLLPDGRPAEGCLRLVPGRAGDAGDAVCAPLSGPPAVVARMRGLRRTEERRALVVRAGAGDVVTATFDGQRLRLQATETAGPAERVVRVRDGRRITARRPTGSRGPRAFVGILPSYAVASRIRVRIEHRGRTTTVVPRTEGAGR